MEQTPRGDFRPRGLRQGATLAALAGVSSAAGLGLGGNESDPHLCQPYGGFPDGVKVDNSIVTLPDLPGIGFEGKADLYREMRALAA